MSQHEFNAAVKNGRLDLLDRDYRIELVAMVREWTHAVIEQIFMNWHKEMTLPAEHAEGAVGDQPIFPASSG